MDTTFRVIKANWNAILSNMMAFILYFVSLERYHFKHSIKDNRFYEDETDGNCCKYKCLWIVQKFLWLTHSGKIGYLHFEWEVNYFQFLACRCSRIDRSLKHLKNSLRIFLNVISFWFIRLWKISYRMFPNKSVFPNLEITVYFIFKFHHNIFE